jgi:ring-1,2-phenylacetyl-CoA epoxidase subunit PaaE
VNQSDNTVEDAITANDSFIENFRLTLDGENHTVPIADGETLLQAALAAGVDAPNYCTEGRCGTCMSWLRSGEVSMLSTRALSKMNIERGYVLACQSRPSSPAPVWLDFDI